jgi:predicted amidophosphoribosyltransferase
VKCSFCGNEFEEDPARKCCRGCSLLGGCVKVKCPRCGYEAPAEPGLVKWLRKLMGKRHE